MQIQSLKMNKFSYGTNRFQKRNQNIRYGSINPSELSPQLLNNLKKMLSVQSIGNIKVLELYSEYIQRADIKHSQEAALKMIEEVIKLRKIIESPIHNQMPDKEKYRHVITLFRDEKTRNAAKYLLSIEDLEQRCSKYNINSVAEIKEIVYNVLLNYGINTKRMYRKYF